MDISPLWRLLIIAGLAYSAGLLGGLSFYRGEIGPRRAPPQPRRGERSTPGRARSRNRLKRWIQDITYSRRRAIEVIVVALWLVAIALLVLWLVVSASNRLINP
ncbi:hypothetical protein [Phenylobacterium sp.]|uniref:hypothetical protein n=1 Tax=Phenylobacterium sp. TaxID=1871053 RepID=UPI0027376D65|nr:hypothetical protein [Phenylobacterium sp.]MDP3658476.1 hypothetical protein [Phenylobacterium sp.]